MPWEDFNFSEKRHVPQNTCKDFCRSEERDVPQMSCRYFSEGEEERSSAYKANVSEKFHILYFLKAYVFAKRGVNGCRYEYRVKNGILIFLIWIVFNLIKYYRVIVTI